MTILGHEFDTIEVLIVIAIVGILVAIVIPAFLIPAERKEFMTYCMEKGHSEQDCKWEWKRLQHGQQSQIMPVVIPMNMGR